jgi:hypothetical protein
MMELTIKPTNLGLAKMRKPPGWIEPTQEEIDEIASMLESMLHQSGQGSYPFDEIDTAQKGDK